MDEDWDLLLSFFPPGWETLASESGALKGPRKDRSPGNLCVLLLHLGSGHSLRETTVRAGHAGLADLSQVALKMRLAKSGPWLLSLCEALLEESLPAGSEMRAVDVPSTPSRGSGRPGIPAAMRPDHVAIAENPSSAPFGP